MKSLFSLSVLFILLFTQSALAQEKMVARDGFQEGFKAVQFGIGNNFNLTNFDGSQISFLTFKSNTKARLFRLSFSTIYNQNERDLIIQEEETDIRYEENDAFDTRFRLNIGNQIYKNTNSDIHPYLTKSLIVGMNIRHSNDSRIRQISAQNISDEFFNEEKVFSPVLGGSIGFGFDYFIAKNISLTAFSSLELEYNYSSYEIDNVTDNTNNTERVFFQDSKNHTLRLGLSNVVFGLTAYF